jgi:hypothetical protein
MSDETTGTTPVANGAAAPTEAAPARSARVREAVKVVARHPLGAIALVGAAVALVEIELAVGILAGLGATALLATKTGPEARQEVLTRSTEVLAKGKVALEKAKVAIASRTKAPAEAPPKSAEPPAPPAASI